MQETVFNPDPGRSQSLCSTAVEPVLWAREPQLLSPKLQLLKPVHSRARVPQQEKPLQLESKATRGALATKNEAFKEISASSKSISSEIFTGS